MIQRSAEWYAARLGHVTASRLADVITTTRNGYGAARGKYMDMIVAERLTGRSQDMRRIKSLEDRAEMEPEARAAYTFYSDNEVDEVGFIQHPRIQFAGASPDGTIGTDGGLEIKCLDAATHIKLISGDDTIMLDYLPQIQFGMACTDRQWWDFVSYSPHMPEEHKVFIRRFERDEDLIGKLEREVERFLAEVTERIARLNFNLS